MKRAWWLAILIPVGLLLMVVSTIYLYDVVTGINSPYRTNTNPNPAYPELGSEWVIHPVDNPGDWLPNGLDAADVNGDGLDDYVTNYEYAGLTRVALHPGGDPAGKAWEAIKVGKFPDTESSAIGDLDQDGQADVVITHGIERAKVPPAVRIFWGLGSPAYSWADAGPIPASLGGWQFLFVRVFDLDLDGDLDIVAGGRASRGAAEGQRETGGEELTWAGIRWFANPGPENGGSRDLESWKMYEIDPRTKSGHGFEFGDLDGDGDPDMVNANADWDTPEGEENIAWYENPGVAGLRQPWPEHVIYQGSEFYGKEQAVIADLDGNGFNDIIAHTETVILWFRNSGDPARLELVRLEKHPAAQWRARPLEIADLNNDGKPDIIGALIHDQGSLPSDKAAVFWMEQTSSGWQTRVIKWGDGFRGLGTFNGEKWDQMIPADVDRDGDLDLVANVEEYNRLRAILSVVWFENPTIP